MSVEALDHLLTKGVRVPYVPGEVTDFAVFKVLVNLAWHANLDGLVWVSDRTQERELDMSRSTIWASRRLLEKEGWLIYTDQRKQKGVKVYKLVIPGFVFSGLTTPTTNAFDDTTSGLVSGLPSGSTSGLASGLPSGLPSGGTSGLFCGLPYQAEKEININEKNANEISKHKNKTNEIPESVRERIKQSKRSRGIYGETSIGEAVQQVFNNLQPSITDEEPF